MDFASVYLGAFRFADLALRRSAEGVPAGRDRGRRPDLRVGHVAVVLDDVLSRGEPAGWPGRSAATPDLGTGCLRVAFGRTLPGHGRPR